MRWAGVILFCVAIAGCNSARNTSGLSQADLELLREEMRQARGHVVSHQAMPVLRGTAPLAHIVNSRGMIRVVDTHGNATIASAEAPARSVIRIDERQGVLLGGEVLTPGPLPEGRVYVVYFEPIIEREPADAEPAPRQQ